MGGNMKQKTYKMEFSSVLPAKVTEVWKATTDFDFVAELNRPFLVLKYDRKKFGTKVGKNYIIKTDQYLFSFLPFGPYDEKVVEWKPCRRLTGIATKSPFRMFRHTHTYEKCRKGTLYADSIEMDPGALGLIALLFIRLLFWNRHRKLLRYFESKAKTTGD